MRSEHRHAVLVVDDHDDVREAMTMLLDAYGFSACGACSGSAALGVIAAGYRPCLVLLDLHMPDMDGWAVWSELRARPETAGIPVVLLSGDIRIVSGYADGISDVLPKPCEPDALLATVTTHARCM